MREGIQIYQGPDGKFCLSLTDWDDRTAALFAELELQGGGYTWEGIVHALVEVHMSGALSKLEIGAEGDNMYATSDAESVLKDVEKLILDAMANHDLLKQAIAHAGDDLE